ncbi:MAG: helix-turn-helix transcriptional regulator [Acidobacteriota bacterium]
MKADLSQALRDLRKSRGISQKFIAQQAGVSPGAISHIERGESNPTVENLQRILTALGCDWLDLACALGHEGKLESTRELLEERFGVPVGDSAEAISANLRSRVKRATDNAARTIAKALHEAADSVAEGIAEDAAERQAGDGRQ